MVAVALPVVTCQGGLEEHLEGEEREGEREGEGEGGERERGGREGRRGEGEREEEGTVSSDLDIAATGEVVDAQWCSVVQQG